MPSIVRVREYKVRDRGQKGIRSKRRIQAEKVEIYARPTKRLCLACTLFRNETSRPQTGSR